MMSKTGIRAAAAYALPFLAASVLSGVTLAQTDKPGAARTALLFDKLCYEMVPNFAGLQERAKKMKWEPITGRRLQGFKPAAEPKVLQAWTFKDLGTGFQIAISQSDMDAQAKKDFPDFAAAQVYSCSIILPAKWPRADMSAAMMKLMGRKPDESADQGRMVFDTWNGKDATRRVIINHMGAKSGGPGGLISITFMLKK
ncbi:MAG: hypothetical protein NWT00_11240 [Beijerinckiaceae bacterium]|jgi:hypothetical protein|nr:hypothetical protein [Beijerinckiaceae bacterium]